MWSRPLFIIIAGLVAPAVSTFMLLATGTPIPIPVWIAFPVLLAIVSGVLLRRPAGELVVGGFAAAVVGVFGLALAFLLVTQGGLSVDKRTRTAFVRAHDNVRYVKLRLGSRRVWQAPALGSDGATGVCAEQAG
jgi:hypothetical protein